MYTWTHHLYCVFTYIYSLLIEKGIGVRQNISSFRVFLCTFVQRSLHFLVSFPFLFLFIELSILQYFPHGLFCTLDFICFLNWELHHFAFVFIYLFFSDCPPPPLLKRSAIYCFLSRICNQGNFEHCMILCWIYSNSVRKSHFLKYIIRFTSLTCVLGEAFRCHVHHFHCLPKASAKKLKLVKILHSELNLIM